LVVHCFALARRSQEFAFAGASPFAALKHLHFLIPIRSMFQIVSTANCTCARTSTEKSMASTRWIRFFGAKPIIF
jgi:hypothetical protein